MGDHFSVHKSCCPVVVDQRESFFEAEQKKLVEKQTNSPYRYHRRQSSSTTNDAPIPLFCSVPKNYTFYFATLTQSHINTEQKLQINNNNNNTNNNTIISLLQHGQLQFNINKHSGKLSTPSITLIEPCYNYESFKHKIDMNTNAIQLKWISNITSINWFYYDDGLSKKGRDNHAKLIVSDSKYGLISEININYNISKPLAKIYPQNNTGTCEIIDFQDDNNTNMDIIKQNGYNITWTATKNGELIFGSNGMKYNTAVVMYNRQQELYVEDWKDIYNAIRYGCGAVYPGFIWIECMLWSHIHDKWFILPRYLSINTPYMEHLYKHYGCNVMLTANENFKDINIVPLKLDSILKMYKNNGLSKGNINNNKIDYDYNNAKLFNIQSIKDLNEKQRNEIKQIHKNISKSLCYCDNGVFGFVSAKFLSGTNDQLIMGLRKREKNDGSVECSVCVFNIYGDVFVDDYILDKYNGYKGLIIL